jgi:CRP-like cAMP-binding protein
MARQDIHNHAFMQGLTGAQIAKLASLATEVTFAENEVIVADGQRSQSLYFVFNGSVAVELCTPRFTVCVQALGSGQVFGWSALLDQHYTLFRVRARERTTALRVADSDLAATCRTDTELGMEILFRAEGGRRARRGDRSEVRRDVRRAAL